MPALRSRLLSAALVAALAGGGLIAPGAATANVPSAVAVCPPASPGLATCFAEKQTSSQPYTATPDSLPAGFGPSDLQSAYQLPASPAGAGQRVYIIDAYDDPSAEADLAIYRSTYGLTACTTANGCFAKLNQSGTASPLPAYNSGWAGEISLDLDMASAICPACGITLIEASDNGSGLYTAIHEAVTLGARFVSMSWGGSEWSGETSYDSYFAVPGVLFAASTGDNGAAGGPSYPAMSANVLAVGGTTLSRAATSRGWSETAWAGAGSGCSAFEANPAWQSFIDTATCPRRAGADVSAVANPNTGVAVYDGGWGVFGGTSASAPIVASIYALAGTPSATSAPQSFPYENSTSFNDVTAGSTGTCATSLICNSAVGWDGPTGLGTPQGVAAVTDSGTSSTPPPPTALGATLSVPSQLVAGEAVSATVTAQIPAGRTLVSTAWTSTRSDCVFSAPTAATTTLTCAAADTGTVTVSAKVTDSSGATKTVSSTLTFSTGTKRDVALAVSFDSQAGSSVTVCTGATSPVVVTVTDATTGEPIKGVTVTLSRLLSGATAPTAAGSVQTGLSGSATSSQIVSSAATYTITASAVGLFNASTPDVVAVAVAKCSPTITASASASTVWYGDSVTVRGSATRPPPSGVGPALPISGLSVAVTVTANAKTTTMATVTTTTDGTFSATFKATTAGELVVSNTAGTAFAAATADLGAFVVQIPSTTLTAGSHAAEIGYGDKLSVSGTLTATAATTYPLSGQTVNVMLLPTGHTTAQSIGSAKVAVDGSFTALVSPTATGALTLTFVGAPGLPAASASAGTITVDTWTPSLTLSASASEVGYGTQITYSGTATRTSSADGTVVAALLPVKLLLTPAAGGAALTLATTTTSATGTYSAKVTPTVTGTVTVVVSNVAGYLNAASVGAPVTVDLWSLAIGASLSASAVTAGTVIAVSGSVSRSCAVGSGIPVGLALSVYGTATGSTTRVLLGNTAVSSTGTYRLSVLPRATGTITVVVAPVAGYVLPASSNPLAITVS